MSFEQISENQLRQFVDAETTFSAWLKARRDAAQVRGSMRWRELRGKNTLLRISTNGSQKVLGGDTPENRAMFESFMRRKEDAEARVASLRSAVETHRSMNRALRVGRVPVVVVDVLNAIEKAGLSQYVLTVGTHALYAYESACGVRIAQSAMATTDVDLFVDARWHISFFTQIDRGESSFIRILQKADPSFRVMDDQKQTAMNSSGFQVDVLRRVAQGDDPHPMRLSDDEDDLWAVQVDLGDLISSAEHFNQVIVASNGEMAEMRTIDPLSFVNLKRMIAADPQREALKRPKDLLQASIVEQLVDRHMPQWQKPALGSSPAPRE